MGDFSRRDDLRTESQVQRSARRPWDLTPFRVSYLMFHLERTDSSASELQLGVHPTVFYSTSHGNIPDSGTFILTC